MKTRLTTAIALLALASACSATHEGADEASRVVAPDAVAPITWSIPEAEQPPLLHGAAEVLTTVARSRYRDVVGRFLEGSPRVYDGVLAVDAGDRGAFPGSPATLTTTIFPNLGYRGVIFERAHVMNLLVGGGERVSKVFQEASEAELGPEWLSPEGLGSAWLDLSMSDAPEALVWGRCFQCMTVLEEAPVQRIVLRAESLDPNDGPPLPVHVEGELEHVAPELLTPELLQRVYRAELGTEPAELQDFRELQPGLWQREHADRTYLRCKEGGSRLVDYRTTWTLEQGSPERSGIGPIEVTGAAACEPFDYGGGS